MPVSATIPVTEDFLESAGPYPSLKALRVHPTNGFLYGIYGGDSDGKLVKLRASDFTQISIVSLAQVNPTDMYYSSVTDRFYVTYFRSGSGANPITEINPTSLAMSEFSNVTSEYLESITGDGTNLYVVNHVAGSSFVFPIALSNGSAGAGLPIAGYTLLNRIRYFGGKLYVMSKNNPNITVQLLRITTTGTVEEASAEIPLVGGDFRLNDIGDSSDHVWIGNRDQTGVIRKFRKTSFINPELIQTNQLSKCATVTRLEGFVWATFENGRAIRINPASGDLRIYTVNPGDSFHSQITGTSEFIYTGTTKIARYHIPSDVTSGTPLWAKRFGGSANDSPVALAIDGSGNIILGVTFRGTVNYGGIDLVSNGDTDLLLAKYNSNGDHQWSYNFGGVNTETMKAIAVDASGNIFVVGEYANIGNVGGIDLPNSGGFDAFIAKYSAAGVHQWSHGFGGIASDSFLGVAVDQQGNAVVTGASAGTTNLGGNNLASHFGANAVTLAKYDTDGNHVWSTMFDSGAACFGNAITIDKDNNIIITGELTEYIDFGGGHLNSEPSTKQDFFITKFTGTGTPSTPPALDWAVKYGGINLDRGTFITTDTAGDIIAITKFSQSTNLGGGTVNGASLFDAAIAKYSGTNGDFVWGYPYVTSVTIPMNSAAVDLQNNVFLTGAFSGRRTCGTTPFDSTKTNTGVDTYDAFVTKLAPADGVCSWFKAYGQQGSDGGSLIARNGSNFVVVGQFTGTIVLGNNTLTSVGGVDIFLMTIAP